MEGQVGTIFETQFRHSDLKSRYTPGIRPSHTAELPLEPGIESDKNKPEHHLLRNSAITAGVGVALLSPLVIMAGKGKSSTPLSRFVNKQITKVFGKMEKLFENPNMSKAERKYLISLQKTTKVLNNLKGLIFNTGPMKDVLLEKTLNKIGLGKLSAKITGFFERTAVTITNAAYAKSNNAFAVMKDSFLQSNKKMMSNPSRVVEINGVSKTVGEWAKVSDSLVQSMDTAYDAFRGPAVKKRSKWLIKKFNGLGSQAFGEMYGKLKEFVTTPKKWVTFITESLVEPTKTRFGRVISSRKKVITNTPQDTLQELNKVISSVEGSLDLTQKDSIDIIKRLKKVAGSYKPNSPQISQNERLSEINSIVDAFKEHLSGNTNYTADEAKKIKKSVGLIKHIIETDKKGHVEELLEIYSHILPKEEFAALEKNVQKSRNALNEAVYTESEKFVDKMRDLKSGSALTDVSTGLLIPLGSTVVGMSMADTKEKKRSVALKVGVPLFTGVLASTWGTIAMYAAGPSLVLALVTSTVTNKVCSVIDKHLKERDAKRLQAKALQPNQ